MDLVLHTRCVEPTSDFKILTDSSTLDIQLQKTQGDVKKVFENSKKDFAKMFLNPLGLNPDLGVQAFTSRTFNTVILNPTATENIEKEEKSYTGEEILLDGTDETYYPLLPLSYELVLPKLTSEELSFEKLLKCVKDGGDSQVLSPAQYLQRLKRTNAMLQKIIHAKTMRIPGINLNTESTQFGNDSVEIIISMRQRIDLIIGSIDLDSIDDADLDDNYDDEDVLEQAVLESIRLLFT